MSGKGSCVLTTNRLVLMNTKGSGQDKLKAFDIPLALMFDEGFEQPFFGANYWKGTCKPLTPGSLPGDPKFKMWFMEGGCMRFIKSIRFCLRKLREAS